MTANDAWGPLAGLAGEWADDEGTVTVNGDSFSYDSCTTYIHSIGGSIAHTDRNTLRRVSAR